MQNTTGEGYAQVECMQVFATNIIEDFALSDIEFAAKSDIEFAARMHSDVNLKEVTHLSLKIPHTSLAVSQPTALFVILLSL